jgi:hypothetical protein
VFDITLNMVFNVVMDEQIKKDKAKLLALGGATKVAELLNLDKRNGGVQRVQNWLTRGIPSKVKVEFSEIFLSNK